jgi:hypothetical protein
MTLDFHAIRPIRNSSNNGFEELCCQLAACEPIPAGSRFVRNGTPDGGVEAYWQYPGDSEHGWQAKLFDKLETPQWQQLDKSVKNALSTHPALAHYTICLPFDLPDAREKGKKSLRQKWDERLTKWERIAKQKGMTVNFDLWGASELLERLSLDRHAGRRWFWFGKTELAPDWFTAHLAEVLAAAGPRYSAELNVQLPIAICFDALGYTAEFREHVAQQRQRYRKSLTKALDSTKVNTKDSKLAATNAAFERAGTAVLRSLSKLSDTLPSAPLFDDVVAAVSGARRATEAVFSHSSSSASPSSVNAESAAPGSVGGVSEYQGYALDNFLTSIREIEEFSESSPSEVAGRPAMLLTGEAGSGKTHLLCDVARLRVDAKLPTIVVLGQQLGRSDVWRQILERLGLRCTRDEFLGALESIAEAKNCRALILIDAINEATEIDWLIDLPPMLEVISRYPRLGVAVSCRSTYTGELVRNDLIPGKLSHIEHDGFASRHFEALTLFCRYYGIETLNAVPLDPEFENPLFLKLYCQGLKNRGLSRPPTGHHGLHRIFSFLLESVNEKLQKRTELDYPSDDPIVQRAVDAIADAMLEAGRYALPREQANKLLDSILPRLDKGYSGSLLRKLIGEGILADNHYRSDEAESPVHIIVFGYERLADYQIARRLLEKYLKGENPNDAFAPDGPFARIFSQERIHHLGGLLSALIILVPERTGYELCELMTQFRASPQYAQSFLEALPWRDGRHITQHAVEYIEELLEQGDPHSAIHSKSDVVIDRLLLLVALPSHPLNATWLDSRLASFSMPERDLLWSTFLHRARRTRRSQRLGAVERLLEWSWPEVEAVDPFAGFDDEVVELAAIAVIWCFTTSNRYIRDRATKALTCILYRRLHLIPALLSRFASVNDPYVTERLLCAIYGAVMRSKGRDQIGRVALDVYQRYFENGRLRPMCSSAIMVGGSSNTRLPLGAPSRSIRRGFGHPTRVRLSPPTFPAGRSLVPSTAHRSTTALRARSIRVGVILRGMYWERNRTAEAFIRGPTSPTRSTSTAA